MEMMKRKVFKFAIVSAVLALVAFAVSVSVTAAETKSSELPEYLGSKACLGCHTDKFQNWEETGHAHMLTQVFKPSDMPGDISSAPAELQAELSRAAWIVANQRFLARDPKDGALRYLNVQWNAANQQYVAYKGGANWETGCAGCHTTGWDEKVAEFVDPGIGCEMCHGPGRDHVLGKGDISKITVTNDAQACGQCHTGGKGANGESWPDYLPGDDLHATGFKFPTIPDPHEGLYPDPAKVKQRQYPQWEKSAHATAKITLDESGHPQERCYACHAAEAFDDKLAGKPTPTSHKEYDAGVSCSACHDPHASNTEGQLRMPKEQLCIACHTASLAQGATFRPGSEVHHPMAEMLQGRGAIDVAPTKGAHSELTCVECHMTEGNHLMRVIRPEEVAGDATRKDTCTACHTDSSKDSRGVYLEMWQESTENRLKAAKADLAVITANQSALSAELKAKFDAAKTNLSFVEADASKGVHNFEYTIKVLNSVTKSFSEIRKAIGK